MALEGRIFRRDVDAGQAGRARAGYRESMLEAFLVFASMALAPTPEATAGAAPARTGEQVVRFQCVLCHGAGMAGAPRIGDRKAWEKRLSAGEEALLRSALQGRGAMPPN